MVITDAGFYTIPIRKEINGHKIEFEFKFAAQGVGDATGGVISVNVDFGALNKNVYYCITDIQHFAQTTIATKLYTETDRWDNLWFPGHIDENFTLMEIPSGNAILEIYKINGMVYLGRPRNTETNAGLYAFMWYGNTNLALYNLTIMGFALKEPLLLSQINRNMIF